MTIRADQGDQALIAAVQRGERGALDLFVRRHDGWVRSVVYATVGNSTAVDDIVQHVWVMVWKQIKSLVDPARWRGWLYKTAKHAAIDAGMKATRHQRHIVASIDRVSVEDYDNDPARVVAVAEEHQRVLKTIKGLPAIYREPFILRHLEGWSYAEIGEAMSLPVDTVETRLVRARRLLRESLKDLDPNSAKEPSER